MLRKVHLIGPGRAGCGVVRLLAAAGHPIGRIAARHISDAEAACTLLGAGTPAPPAQALETGSVTLLAVPDAALPGLASDLARGPALAGACALHLSGALTSACLGPLRAREVSVGSCHPSFSFAARDQPAASLRDVAFSVEGDAEARAAAIQLVTSLEGQVLELDAHQKVLHHAAAVAASNFLITLLDLAQQLEAHAGLAPEAARRALQPLVRSAVENWQQRGSPAALTGPIERGEAEVLRRQRQALPHHLRPLFEQLARATLDVARRKGSLAPEQLDQLTRLLEEPA